MNKKDCERLAKLHYFRASRYEEAREECMERRELMRVMYFAIMRDEAFRNYNRYNKAIKNPLRRIFL